MPRVITLVHGTFAKGAAWCQPTSPLCRTLSSALDDQIVFAPFIWSARNSFTDRQHAVDDLIEHFSRLRLRYPDFKHSAVAHSHGGNILVKALSCNPGILDSAVCLATPFFIIQPREKDDELEKSAEKLLVDLPLLALLFPIVIWAIPLLPAAISVTTIFVFGILLATIALMAYIAKSLALRLSRTAQTVTTRLLASSVSHFEDSYKVLIMRSPHGEAYLSFGTITFCNWILEKLRKLLLLFDKAGHKAPASKKFLVFAVLLAAAGLADHFHVERHIPDSAENVLIISLIIVQFLTSFSFLLGSSLLSLGFGVDAFWAAWRTRISVESTPPGFWRIFVLTTDPFARGMRHSMPYTSQEGIHVIASWLKQDHAT